VQGGISLLLRDWNDIIISRSSAILIVLPIDDEFGDMGVDAEEVDAVAEGADVYVHSILMIYII
jgi:hypothetical protein